MASPENAKPVAWNQDYSGGIEAIDDDHRKLVTLLNELSVGLASDRPVRNLKLTLEALAKQTQNHFANEERLMRQHFYPDVLKHKAEHAKLMGQVQTLDAAVRSGRMALSQELVTFLEHWVVSHTLGMDKALATFLQACGA
ncbi:MAG: bacteriohemerythrin [Bryobacteraceae bacterium]